MSGVQLSPGLLADLGVSAWQAKPAFQQAGVEFAPVVDAALHLSDESGVMPLASTHQRPALPFWVLLGSGLNAIWQADNNQVWLLWQAILQFHLSDVSQMRFFDTDSLQDEDLQFEVLEQIIETGAERVFTMDADHPINEMLIEGAQLVVLPSFEQMLDQPLLKRDVYMALSEAGFNRVEV